MSGTPCIGKLGGGHGDWFAELDYFVGEATLYERKPGFNAEVATIRLGDFFAEDDDYGFELDPRDPQHVRLLRIVFATELERSLRNIVGLCDESERSKDMEVDDLRYVVDRIRHECNYALGRVEPIMPENPKSVAVMASGD